MFYWLKYYIKWFLIPLGILTILFLIHYLIVINYFENLYQYHSVEVRERVINQEKSKFYISLIGNSILFLLQFFGTLLLFNLTFLLYELKFKFSELFKYISLCSLSLLIIYLALPLLLITNYEIYTFDYLYDFENYFNFSKLTDINTHRVYKNFLENFSVTQLIFMFTLIVCLRKITQKSFIENLKLVGITYSIGFTLWVLFAFLMDFNFFY